MDQVKSNIIKERDEHRFVGFYDSAAIDKFIDTLRRRHRHTEFVPVVKPQDLMLGPDAVINKSLYYTSNALSILCDKLLPGLYSSVSFLAGFKFSIEDETYDPRVDQNVSLAIKLFNEVVRARFDKVKGYRLVVDRYDNVIDGIISDQYAFIPNIEIYERIKSVLPDLEFNEGILSGRTARIIWTVPDSLFVSPEISRMFKIGICLTNSEATNSALAIAPAIVHTANDVKIIKPVHNNKKIVHKGSNIEFKIQAATQKLKQTITQMSQIEPSLKSMMDLDFYLGERERDIKTTISDIIQLFHNKGIGKILVRTSISKSLFSGNHARRRKVLNLMDVWLSIAGEAKSLPLLQRHRAEQNLYKLLHRSVILGARTISRQRHVEVTKHD